MLYCLLLLLNNFSAISGNGYVNCDQKAIRLDHLAPDIVLAHLAQKQIDYDDIVLLDGLGSGSYATVHKGTYKGN